MTNTDELSVVSAEPFSKAVSQFHELINSCDAKAFLIGAGCSKCAGLPLTKELTEKVIADAELDCLSKQVLITIRAIFSGAPDAHIEDYLSEIVDLLAITDRRAERGVEQNTVVVGDASYTAEQLRKASNQIKRAIASTIRRENKHNYASGIRSLGAQTRSSGQTSAFTASGLSGTQL